MRGTRSNMRVTEVAAVILLAVATVGSAWCAFQASQWNGEQADLSQEASTHRVEANRLFSLGTQLVAYDSASIAQYAAAMSSDQKDLATFIKASLVRKDFLPILEQWEADVIAGSIPTPLPEDDDYMSKQFSEYQQETAAAEASSVASDEASETASAYVLGALLVAVSLFFAGVTTSFRMRSVRILLLIASGLTLAFAASQVAGLGVIT